MQNKFKFKKCFESFILEIYRSMMTCVSDYLYATYLLYSRNAFNKQKNSLIIYIHTSFIKF